MLEAALSLNTEKKFWFNSLFSLSCLTIKYLVYYNRVLCSWQRRQNSSHIWTEATAAISQQPKATAKRKSVNAVDCQAVYLRGNNVFTPFTTLCFPSSSATQRKARLKWPSIENRRTLSETVWFQQITTSKRLQNTTHSWKLEKLQIKWSKRLVVMRNPDLRESFKRSESQGHVPPV